MRIPLSVSDIDSKRFSKIAKALRKRWSIGDLSLLQAQNLLALGFGYRNLHDLQSNLFHEIPADAGALLGSRAAIKSSVAWNISRHAGVAFSLAHGLVDSLQLQILSCDAFTSDAAHEKWIYESRKQGRFVVMDEFGYYGTEPWDERTPGLLAAGAPPYRFVILPSGQAIRWGKIIEQISKLPSDVAIRLLSEDHYSVYKTDQDRLAAFYRQEVFPVVEQSAADAVRDERELPKGFSIRARGERGLMICNEALDGVIPIIYDKHSDQIFRDIVTLMTLGAVSTDREMFSARPDGLWEEAPGSLGDQTTKMWVLNGLPGLADSALGVSKHMVARNQAYLRCSGWLDESSIPDLIAESFDVQKKPAGLSTQAAPSWHVGFHEMASKALRGRAIDAKGNLLAALKSGALANLLKSYASEMPEDESAVIRQIAQWHPDKPYEPEDLESTSSDDDPVYRQEAIDECRRDHEAAIAHYRSVGEEIVRGIPEIACLGALKLGWMHYNLHHETYDSRDAYLIDNFDPKNLNQTAEFLAFLCSHYCAMVNNGCTSSAGRGDLASALYIAVDLVLRGACRPEELGRQYMKIEQFSAAVRKQDKRIRAIMEWDAHMEQQVLIQAQGKYLYASRPVPAERQESSLHSIMRSGRKHNVSVMQAEQHFPGLHEDSKFGDVVSALRSMRDVFNANKQISHQDE